jgi:hypothetical protein
MRRPIILAACATFLVAEKAPPAPAPTFMVGTDTITTVEAKLGKPAATTRLGDGTTIIVYMDVRAHAKATSFVPIVGLFAGGAKGATEIRTFTFDSGGILRSDTDTTSNVNCNSSIAGAHCH